MELPQAQKKLQFRYALDGTMPWVGSATAVSYNLKKLNQAASFHDGAFVCTQKGIYQFTGRAKNSKIW